MSWPLHRRRTTAARPGASLRHEEGSLLIEVMITALVLIVISLGVLTAFDGASATSGTDRARSIAGGVAQQDQERMRSMPVSKLSNYLATQTQTVAGVPYTVTSRADWVSDSSGSASCSSGSLNADYLSISSSVTWPEMHKSPAVVIKSLVSPPSGSFGPTEGTLSVELRDRDASPLAGVTVSAAGASSISDTTNANGCVIFGFITAGSYLISLPSTTCVDRQGNQPTLNTTVAAQSVTSVTLDCDTPGSMTASFDTRSLNNPNPGTVVPSKGRYLTVSQSGLTAPGTKVSGTGTAQLSISTGSLFPFTDPYNVYSGNCTGADPTLYGQPSQPAPSGLLVGRGGSYTVTVRQPALNVTVTRSGNPLPGARVRATATTATCGGVFDLGPTNSYGQLPDPGMPYGTYSVCADDGTRKSTPVTVTNTNPLGSSAVTLSIPTNGSQSTCP